MRLLFLIFAVFFSRNIQAQKVQKLEFPANQYTSLELLHAKFEDSNFQNIPVFNDFQKVRDTSFVMLKNYKEYGVKHIRKDSTNVLLLLDRLVDSNGNKTGINKILNYNEFVLSPNERIVIGYCGIKDKWDVNQIYAAVFDLQKAQAFNGNIAEIIKTLWKIDEKGFTLFRTHSDLTCFSDTNYIIQLTK